MHLVTKFNTLAYLDLSRKFSDMQKSYERALSKVNSLTARVEELWSENKVLGEKLGDLNRVECALGRDTVETIVQGEKSLEEAQRKQNRERKRKIDRGGEMKKHLTCFCDLVIMDNKSIMW